MNGSLRDLGAELAAWLAEHPEASRRRSPPASGRGRRRCALLAADARSSSYHPRWRPREQRQALASGGNTRPCRWDTRPSLSASEATDHLAATLSGCCEAPGLPMVGEPGWADRRLEALIVESEAPR